MGREGDQERKGVGGKGGKRDEKGIKECYAHVALLTGNIKIIY